MVHSQAEASYPLTESSPCSQLETARDCGQALVTNRLLRKGHRKSTRGCYDCKRRKIKCQETRPSCQNCERLSLSCRYPSEPASVVSRTVTVALQQPFSSLQVANVFSLTDMRLFHHFLVAAWPHLPVRVDNIWLDYVVPIAHQCDYLMHAMLSLSAAHLSKLTSTPTFNTINLAVPGQNHRLAALRGLNTALKLPLTSTEAGDAAIATCYALLMQSWYDDDGLPASLVLTRSCHFTTSWVRNQKCGKASLLSADDRCSRVKTMKDRLRDAPIYDMAFVEGALIALDDLEVQCIEGVESETALWRDLRRAYASLAVGPVASYNAYVKLDHSITLLDPDAMQRLLDTTNEITQLLLAFLVALHLVMRPISCRERKDYTVSFYSIRMSGWIPGIWNAVGERAQMKMEWPMWVSSLHRKGKLERWSLRKVES